MNGNSKGGLEMMRPKEGACIIIYGFICSALGFIIGKIM